MSIYKNKVSQTKKKKNKKKNYIQILCHQIFYLQINYKKSEVIFNFSVSIKQGRSQSVVAIVNSTAQFPIIREISS